MAQRTNHLISRFLTIAPFVQRAVAPSWLRQLPKVPWKVEGKIQLLASKVFRFTLAVHCNILQELRAYIWILQNSIFYTQLSYISYHPHFHQKLGVCLKYWLPWLTAQTWLLWLHNPGRDVHLCSKEVWKP